MRRERSPRSSGSPPHRALVRQPVRHRLAIHPYHPGLAYRFEHRLFLSETPHNGHGNSFAALLELRVPCFLNLTRRDTDARSEAELAAAFAANLKREWPGDELPVIYYDPRSLDPVPDRRAVLHAKCVVVDDRYALVTSANFTDAAHQRNIELGALIRDTVLATSIRRQFDGLVDTGELRRLGRPA